MRRLAVLSLGLLAVAACQRIDPDPALRRTSTELSAALGPRAPAPPLCCPADDVRVASLLEGGVTADEAAQLAVLNNPAVQSTLLRIGISQAEVVQAGLLTNPTLTLTLRFPDGGGLANFEVAVSQMIAELWQIPARVRSAERDLDRTVLDVARAVSLAALDAQQAYWRAVAADRERDLAQENLAITQQLLDLTLARREAGAASEVDVNLARSQHLEVELSARTAGLAAVEARAELCKRLGLAVPPGKLVLADVLGDAPPLAPESASAVVAVAESQRLDRRAIEQSIAAARAKVEYERLRFLRQIELGLSIERMERRQRSRPNRFADAAWDSARAGTLMPPSLRPQEKEAEDWVVGPTLGVELPIFDQNQAQIAKAEYERGQAEAALAAIERELVQDAHLAFARLSVAIDNLRFYRDELLPVRGQGLTLAREAYERGRTTLPSVLDAQRTLLETRSGYVRAQRDVAVARIEIERIAGVPFEKLGEPGAAD